jgi:hypothetical protein
MSEIVNAAHNDGQNQVFTNIGVIGTLGTADTRGTALTLPFGVDPRNGAAYVVPLDNLPTEGDNPSYNLTYDSSGNLLTITKIIGTVDYIKSLTWSDGYLSTVSAWV